MDGITPTYNVGGNGGFDNSWMFLFGILALFGIGGNGLFGGNNGNSNALQADINRGFDNQNTMAQTRDILSAVTNGTAQTIAASTANATNAINAIKDGNASLIREFGNVETALTALGGNMQQCCCSTLRAIDGVNYNAAMNTAAIKEVIIAENQKTRDLFTTNEMNAMRNRINQLELQNAVAGVVRYPSATTYCSGANPFGCGCNFNGNI